jgi:hypothetical protein
MRCCLLMLMLVVAAPAAAQQIHYVRAVPGSPRQLWVVGRDLWVGSDQVYHPTNNTARLTVNGMAATWRILRGAAYQENDGMEANRCWPYAQMYLLPPGVSAGPVEIEFIRNDGKTVSLKGVVPAESRWQSPVTDGPAEERGTVVDVPANTTLDLGGKTLYPSARFSGRSFVVMGDRARLVNGRIVIPDDAPDSIVEAVRLAGSGHQLVNLVIDHQQQGDECCVYLDDSSDSQFLNVQTIGMRNYECGPRNTPSRNTWHQCECIGLRGGRAGMIGRGMIGRQNLVLWTRWHDIDRGPTGSQYGSPTEQCVFWECHQHDTGRHVVLQQDNFRDAGASEGLLTENKDCFITKGKAGGNIVHLEVSGPEDRGVFLADRDHVKAGYHACLLNHKTWARIVDVKRISKTERVLVCDRELPAGDCTVRVGNAQVECSYLRCQFERGRAGVFLFGQTCDQVICQCDFSGMVQGCVVKLERVRLPGEYATHWGLQAPFCTRCRTSPVLIRDYTP